MKTKKYIIKHFIDRNYGKFENGALTLSSVCDAYPFNDQVTLFDTEEEAAEAINTYKPEKEGNSITSNDVVVVLPIYL